MLEEALLTLAAAGGTAVVTAAGTDAWTGMRAAVAKLLGRGDRERERIELERLDRTATVALEAAATAEQPGSGRRSGAEHALASEESLWRGSFERLLEEAAGTEERERLAAELRVLLARHAQPEQVGGGAMRNVFNGPAAVQIGDHNRQDVQFSPTAPQPGPAGGNAPMTDDDSAARLPPGEQTVHHTYNGPTALVFGDKNVQRIRFEMHPRPDLPWPVKLGVLPREAACYQPHGALLDRVDPAGGAARPLAVVLTGPAGVGKTQSAAQHARRAWALREVDLLLWVNASSRATIVEAYAAAAARLLGVDQGDLDLAARAFLDWLYPRPAEGGTEPRRWLVILDDVVQPSDLRDLWPPPSEHGRVLVTTRSREAALTGADRKLVTVGLYTPQEAVAYLTQYLGDHGRHESTEALEALAQDLGLLPLALSQAATYLLDSGQDAETYRRRLADRAGTLEEVLPEQGSLPDDQATTLAAAWSLSIDRADRRKPRGLALPMMELAAMLDPNGIPLAVLTGGPARAHLVAHKTANGEGPSEVATEGDAANAVRSLHLMNLLDHTVNSETYSVRIHQLIQRAVRDRRSPQQLEAVARAAGDALVAAWPAEELDTELAQVLRANTAALIRSGGAALLAPHVHPVLLRVGDSLSAAGRVGAAIRHYTRLLDHVGRTLGPDCPSVLAVRRALATQRCLGGEPVRAAEELQEVLADQTRVLGADSEETLATRHNLIWAQWTTGEVQAAERDLRKLLADRLRVQGPDHPDTLETRHNLYHAWHELGDSHRAVEAYQRLVADRLRINGPDHPDTLSARHQMGGIKGIMGDTAGARTELSAVLADRVRVQGADHPATLAARHALARLHGEAGHPEEAVAALLALYEDRARILGAYHPETMGTRRLLAHWQAVAGHRDEAIATLEAVLSDQEGVLDPGHPDLVETRRELSKQRTPRPELAAGPGPDMTVPSD
ncbi:tetratricopeptide repeat protein [Streptacidiphilus jiangxiensis]|uniref:Tetratricopeptide repeat-containing protein n=1 Tax=Streptacidiphilus jiangxiensis TaxID=235985 RepID=A0A1H7NRT6_STRJI|nr:tetratricopeptide repeat protein [Streptacidiphilus jiangxiensis]SEL25748.1 Tetratricopeptide repeat-containing protein [Streptacidiphilus jiangxiensis]